MQIEQLLSLLRLLTVAAGILAAVLIGIAVWLSRKHSIKEAKKILAEAPPPEPKPKREKPPKKEKPPKPAKQPKEPKPKKIKEKAPVSEAKEKPIKEKKQKPAPKEAEKRTPAKPPKEKKRKSSHFFGIKKSKDAAPQSQPVVPAKRRVVRQRLPEGTEAQLQTLFSVPGLDNCQGWMIYTDNTDLIEPTQEPQKGVEYHELT